MLLPETLLGRAIPAYEGTCFAVVPSLVLSALRPRREITAHDGVLGAVRTRGSPTGMPEEPAFERAGRTALECVNLADPWHDCRECDSVERPARLWSGRWLSHHSHQRRGPGHSRERAGADPSVNGRRWRFLDAHKPGLCSFQGSPGLRRPPPSGFSSAVRVPRARSRVSLSPSSAAGNSEGQGQVPRQPYAKPRTPCRRSCSRAAISALRRSICSSRPQPFSTRPADFASSCHQRSQ